MGETMLRTSLGEVSARNLADVTKTAPKMGSLSPRWLLRRAGHHCAQPILRRFGHEATVRPSLGIYNDETDIELLVRALRELDAGRRR